jgi:hypothetical protein
LDVQIKNDGFKCRKSPDSSAAQTTTNTCSSNMQKPQWLCGPDSIPGESFFCCYCIDFNKRGPLAGARLDSQVPAVLGKYFP